ncbi:MAG TPA: hypothetical protein VM099_04100 [Gemmatimonadaceae bacterium]|nr:hypothetical protein [Gemmatimonadaceae bacterium]
MNRYHRRFHIIRIPIAALLVASACKGTSDPPPPPADVCPVLPHWTNGIVPILFDDFERPNQIGLGTPHEGTSWTLYGPGSVGLARIENGSYMGGPPAPGPSGNLVYAASFLVSAPEFFGAQFSFVTTANAGGQDGEIAMMSSSDGPPGKALWQNILHMVVSPTSWVLTVYRNGVPHLLKTGTSAGLLTLVPDGRQYEMRLQVLGDTVQVYLPNGNVVQACDPDVSDAHGNQLIFEHVYTNQSAHYGRFDTVFGFIEP